MDTFISDFNWLWTYFVIIGAAFGVIGIWKLVDEVRFRLERRRYRRAHLTRGGATWAKKHVTSVEKFRTSGPQ